MSAYPRMVYRQGDMLPEHGVDYLIILDEIEEEAAIGEGWRVGLDPLDHDGDGKPGGVRRGRPRKND
ncbi:hypothetical protein [Novosphingobium sp. MMS21-SN21R]|uniref:hypothetical protein n=1 Tax=Novosphingobium sp. MMS21-SN21R TaxID=2969298 RepID=UPI0028840C41|nr:hypothetical protein [Novosphingobium sp. MMS21-SN21R]MDT0507530.1 hypothetical protein [Novosphingobium sp. MMS21-SN21R]